MSHTLSLSLTLHYMQVSLTCSRQAVAAAIALASSGRGWEVALVTATWWWSGGASTGDGDVSTVSEYLRDVGSVAAEAAGAHVALTSDCIGHNSRKMGRVSLLTCTHSVCTTVVQASSTPRDRLTRLHCQLGGHCTGHDH